MKGGRLLLTVLAVAALVLVTVVTQLAAMSMTSQIVYTEKAFVVVRMPSVSSTAVADSSGHVTTNEKASPTGPVSQRHPIRFTQQQPPPLATSVSSPLRIVLPWTSKPTLSFAGDLRRDMLWRCGAEVASPHQLARGQNSDTTAKRCVFMPRRSTGSDPASAAALQAQAEAADIVLIDSIGKMKHDVRDLGAVVARRLPPLPSHVNTGIEAELPRVVSNVAAGAARSGLPKVALWNTENWRGRVDEWSSKYSVRWLNLTNSSRDVFWGRFAFVASFESTAQAFVPYANNFDFMDARMRTMREDFVPGTARLRMSAMYMASNCFTRWASGAPAIAQAAFEAIAARGEAVKRMRDRDNFVKELQRAGLTVASYGACLKTHDDVDERCKVRHSKHAKLCTASTHLYYLSLENSFYPDYVTEKLYEPLLAGTIPVYLGAPNVEAFVPTTHVLINAADFPTIAALMRYLQCVAKNTTLIEHYRGWRSRPLFASWPGLVGTPNLCRVCDSAHSGLAAKARHGDAPLMPNVTVPEVNRGSQRPLPCG
jgi:hypothetical protein